MDKTNQLKLSILIPARNEESAIEATVSEIIRTIEPANFPYEILVVNDGSLDNTEEILKQLSAANQFVRFVNNFSHNGLGLAIQKGIDHYDGDAVAIVMADGSDSPADIIKYYEALQEGYDCVFGSRFIKGSHVKDYPPHKLILNRLTNIFIRQLFRLNYNDVTNAFKCYRKNVIDGIKPILSHHFNITVELPLKAIVRGYSSKIIPISWKNRTSGISKLKIKEMGSRYLFIVLYVFLEKMLTRGDYKKSN